MKTKNYHGVHKYLSCELLITTSCNMSCTYCIARDLDVATMHADCGKSAIEMFISLGEGAKLLDFTFTGGEPLLCFSSLKYFTHYANRRAKEAGMEVNFVLKTNGTILNRQIIDFLTSRNFKVILSIDGPRNVHDKFRKGTAGEATHRKVAMNLEKLLQKGIPCVASLTIHPSQANNILRNIKYLHELGAQHIDIGPVYGTVDWSEKAILALCQSLQDIASYMRKVNGSLEVGPLYKESEHVGGILADSWGCSAGLTNLAFMSSGQITGCSALAMLVPNYPNLLIGDVRTGLNDLAVQNLLGLSQAQVGERLLCEHCEAGANCTGGCLAINLAVNGKPFLPPPLYCQTISSIPKIWHSAWGDTDMGSGPALAQNGISRGNPPLA